MDTTFRLREQAGLLRNLVSVAQLRATRGDLFRSAPLATRAGFAPAPDLARWLDINDRYQHPEGEVTIGVIGKYVGLQDAYKSLSEALTHGGMANRVKVNVRWIDAELFENGEDDLAELGRTPSRWDAPRVTTKPQMFA